MTPPYTAHRTELSGFSLTEVVIAMAIASVGLLAIVGLMPHALESARDSADQTAIGAVLEDVHDRLEGVPLKPGTPSMSPLFYDQQGRFVHSYEMEKFFKVDLELAEFDAANRPPDVAGLLALSVEISWPLDENDQPLGKPQPKTTVSYGVTTLTGPDWTEIDPDYEPKIEF
ncbi:MAG: prepilin-type N-terminal cleavage/methylation domain-containing protein [Verrucomicrobiales bacterium]|nr:prepilin-type N-terminal cleavage/methylation domain-containing protein [Verrucomicrobiales bacterium]